MAGREGVDADQPRPRRVGEAQAFAHGGEEGYGDPRLSEHVPLAAPLQVDALAWLVHRPRLPGRRRRGGRRPRAVDPDAMETGCDYLRRRLRGGDSASVVSRDRYHSSTKPEIAYHPPVSPRRSNESEMSGDPGFHIDTSGPALPRALALNRFAVRCSGSHRVTRLPRPSTLEGRREVEDRLGQAIFVAGPVAYAAGEVAGGTVVEVNCEFDWLLHQFDLRAALKRQAGRRGFRAWFGRGGELHVAGLPGGQEIDRIQLQRRLRLRVSTDEGNGETALTARHGTCWVTGTLDEPAVQRCAVGEMAVRLTEGTPRRGEVARAEGDELVLRVGDQDLMVDAHGYAVTASAAYVRRHHGGEVLRELQVASGSITVRGQRNRYAVKDRFEALLEDLGALGWTIDLREGHTAIVECAWTEIRIQEAE